MVGRLKAGKYAADQQDLAPGATVKLSNLRFTRIDDGPPQPVRPGRVVYSNRTPLPSGSSRRLVLEGLIEGFRPGPQIGQESTSGRVVQLFAVLGDVPVPEVR